MFYSFILSAKSKKQSIKQMLFDCSKKAFVAEFVEVSGYFFGYLCSKGKDVSDYVYTEDKNFYYLNGYIKNKEEVKALLLSYDSQLNVHAFKDPQLFCYVYKLIGQQAFKKIRGVYNFLIVKANGDLEIHRDILGLMPLYFTQQMDALWLTNQAKLLLGNQTIDMSLKPFDVFNAFREHIPDDFSIFNHIHKVSPGGVLSCIDNRLSVEKSFYEFDLSQELVYEKNEGVDKLEKILNEAVKNSILDSSSVSVLLSGGLDSSTVVAVCRKYMKNLHTISMGTNTSDEFEWAKIVAKSMNSHHQELIIDDNMVLNGVANAVYENEIFDALSAEIQAPLYCLYSHISKFQSDMKVLTGYGADLLFGGTLEPGEALGSVNDLLWKQIYRTKWTGEMSPFLANKFGIEIEHVFWDLDLIEFATTLSAVHKINENEVKLILREFSNDRTALPKNVVWRKKIGIHQASSINSIFSDLLGAGKDDSYDKKNIFVYNLFKLFFEERKPLGQVDLKKMANDFRLSMLKSEISTDEIDEKLLENGTLILKFNNSENHNVFSKDLMDSLENSLLLAESDDRVKSIVLTGGIGKSFSAGGDFKEVKDFRGGVEVDLWIDRIIDLYNVCLTISKPTIAAIDEHAIGIGFQIAMLFDWRIGTPFTKLSMPELKHGISCTIGACILEKLCGYSVMRKIIYGSEGVSIQNACNYRLLDEIVESDKLLTTALSVASRLASYPVVSYQYTKKMINLSFIESLNSIRAITKEAHRAAFRNGSSQRHFEKVLKNKYQNHEMCVTA